MKVPIVMTASSPEFEERVVIVLKTLDEIIGRDPRNYVRVSGQKKGEPDFLEHQVRIQSLKDFFIVQTPKNKDEAY
jgi:hypothetical protein